MTAPQRIFAAAASFALPLSASADPLLTSWKTDDSGQYARIFLSKEAALAGESVTTWDGQTLPAYSGIQKVEFSDDWVYVNSTGLASHDMGPWYFNEAKTNLFTNLPVNQNTLTQLPRNPVEAASKEINQLGSLGLWVNGVGLFNMLDGFYYDNGQETQGGPDASLTAYWVRNAMYVEVVTFDNTNGHQPPSGDYHYHADPKAVRYQLGDNVRYEPGTGADNNGVYYEDLSDMKHSPILGWAYDGFPIYGPYGYDDPDPTSTDTTVRRIESGFVPRDGNNGTVNLAQTGRVTLAKWSAEMRGLTTTGSTYAITDVSKRGPAVSATHVIGYWIEDHAHLGDLGFTQGVDFDLDVYNGRFCRTPDYPEGIYAYFVTIDENDAPAFPYAIGRQWYGEVNGGAIAEVTEATTVQVDAGPASDVEIVDTSVDPAAETITLTWSSVEGGQYAISTSSDLETWMTLGGTVPGTALTSATSLALEAGGASFYKVELDSISEYDSEGAAGGGGGPGGGGPGQPGTGNPTDGFVFAFGDVPPQPNLIVNPRVGGVPATVVASTPGPPPMGGTVTLSFNDSGFASGVPVTATYTHSPPGQGTVTATSNNAYTKP